MSTELISKIREIITPVVEARGLEIFDIEFQNESMGKVLRIYIDKLGGVSLKDCEDVSSMIEMILDTNELISEKYFLEVSSPGLYRDLRNIRDFSRFVGSRIKVKLYSSVNNQKVFIGILKEVSSEKIKLILDNKSEIEVDFRNICKANLEPDINELFNKKST